jgi:hypothetical protein
MQIGIGLANYETAHNVLPPGCVNRTGPVREVPMSLGLASDGRPVANVSGDQSDQYHVGWVLQILPFIDKRNIYESFDFSHGIYHKSNAPALGHTLDLFACPSGGGSFAGCHNDVETPIDIDNNGVLFLNSSVTNEDVADGLSNTIYLGETGGTLDWAAGTRATLRNAGSRINGNIYKQLKTTPKRNSKLITTVGGFSSSHVGGANFLMGDGRLVFLKDRIDLTLFGRLANRADGQLVDIF